MRVIALLMYLVVIAPIAHSGEADVIDVQVSCSDERVCDFNVTVRHADEGWDHYADRWEVRTPDGKRLASRTLQHPHVDEQPFTRSLTNVRIPEGIDEIVVRARDSRHKYGGREVAVKLTD
jgi:hypothetical protein